MKKSNLLCMAVIIAVLISVFPPAVFTKPVKAEGAKWTVMVYMTGSDLETTGAAATIDITEMLRSGMNTEQVQVVAATGGAKTWFSAIPNDAVSYYLIRGEEPEALVQNELSSMGDPLTLTQFLTYSYQNFPAEKYALILWDHGGGPMEGVCYDELFLNDRKKDTLSLPELSQALSDSPFSEENKLEIIGFDACMMGSVETASVCRPYARYMIASEETEPKDGWDYSFLSSMENDMAGSDTGQRVVDLYLQGLSYDPYEPRTLACISLEEMPALEQGMNDLFSYLEPQISPETFSALSNGRKDAKNFGRSTTGVEYDLVDIYNLIEQYLPTAGDAAQKVLDAVSNIVIYEGSSSEDAHGLSVYYPYYNKDYYQSVWKDLYDLIGFSQGYRNYLNSFASIWLGDALVTFTDLKPQFQPNEDGTVHISLELTPEQAANYASAELVVMSDTGNGSYEKIWETQDVQFDGNTLSADYNYYTLYVEDMSGMPMMPFPITYNLVDDSCFLLIKSLSFEENPETGFMEANEKYAWLRCRIDRDTGEVYPVSVIPIEDLALDPVTLYTGRQVGTLDALTWPEFYICNEKSSLSTETWPMHRENKADYLTAVNIVNTNSEWKLVFRQDFNLAAEKYLYAQFVIRDVQGNETGIKPILINGINEEPQNQIRKGLVICFGNGQGIPGVTVQIQAGDQVFTAITDENGEYSMEGVPNGAILISTSGEPYAPFPDNPYTLPVTFTDLPFTIPADSSFLNFLFYGMEFGSYELPVIGLGQA